MIVNESRSLAFLRLPDSESIMSSVSLKKKKNSMTARVIAYSSLNPQLLVSCLETSKIS